MTNMRQALSHSPSNNAPFSVVNLAVERRARLRVENQLILHIICIALHAINGLEETVSHGNLEVCCSCCGQAFS